METLAAESRLVPLDRRIVRRVGNEIVPIAAYDNAAYAANAVDGLGRVRPFADKVAQANDVPNAALRDVIQHGIQRRHISVNVRNDGNALHIRTSSAASS
jgi:hypothetical protein